MFVFFFFQGTRANWNLREKKWKTKKRTLIYRLNIFRLKALAIAPIWRKGNRCDREPDEIDTFFFHHFITLALTERSLLSLRNYLASHVGSPLIKEIMYSLERIDAKKKERNVRVRAWNKSSSCFRIFQINNINTYCLSLFFSPDVSPPPSCWHLFYKL